MSDFIDRNAFPVIYGYGHVDRKHCFFDDTLSTTEPCELCLDCHHNLALEDYKSNEVMDHCLVCNAVRWYILVPNGVYEEMSMFPGDESSTVVSDQMSPTTPSVTSSGSSTPTSEAEHYYHEPSSPPKHEPAAATSSTTISTLLAYSNDLTLISGHFASADDRPRGFHVACRYLDSLLAPILGCIPDIEGYELAAPPPFSGQAGLQVMVHARVHNDFSNLPASTTFLPHGPVREPCVTEMVLPGAYEHLSSPVLAAKPKSPVVHRRNESEDSGIGLGAGIIEEGSDLDIDME